MNTIRWNKQKFSSLNMAIVNPRAEKKAPPTQERMRGRRTATLCGMLLCLAIGMIFSNIHYGAAPSQLQPTFIEDKIEVVPSTHLGLRDLAGREINPFQSSNAKWLVFFFVSVDCPISNRYAPEIRRLHTKFAPRGVEFWLVHPNADEGAEVIRNHTKEYQYTFGVLRDAEHLFVKKTRARVTPEVALFERVGSMVYGGAIDNRLVDFGKERPAATEHYLEDALKAVLQGSPVLHSRTKAIGCYIADKP